MADRKGSALSTAATAVGLFLYGWVGSTPYKVAFATFFREKLTADRTYYVSTAGSDSNDGLTAGAPFATLNKARDAILALDLNGYTATIQHAASQTATIGLQFTTAPVGGSVVLDMGASTLNVTGNHAVSVSCLMALTIQNGTFRTTTSGYAAVADAPGAKLTIGSSVTFGASASGHIRAFGGGYVVCTSSYTISGASAIHLEAVVGGIVSMASITVTVTGTPAITNFAVCQETSVMRLFSVTYSGAATGTRYFVSLNAVINTFGGGASYLPGNASGSTATGGQYA